MLNNWFIDLLSKPGDISNKRSGSVGVFVKNSLVVTIRKDLDIIFLNLITSLEVVKKKCLENPLFNAWFRTLDEERLKNAWFRILKKFLI